MDLLTFAALALGPGLFWLWFFYRKDHLHPEPRALVAHAFLFGMLAVIPAAIIEAVADAIIPFTHARNILTLFIGTIFVVGPTEELLKYAVVRWRIYSRPEFDEPVDGVVYAAAAALGFATLENVFYALSFGVGVMLVRGPVSTLAHVLFAAPWGYALGLAKQVPPAEGAARIRTGLIVAMLGHGAFDFFLYTGQTGSYWALLVPLAFVLIYLMWRGTMKDISDALRWRPNPPGVPPASGPAAGVGPPVPP